MVSIDDEISQLEDEQSYMYDEPQPEKKKKKKKKASINMAVLLYACGLLLT
jgi:hypothetical protein